MDMDDPILKDKRFAKIATDKKFRSVSKKHKKVDIDKRFGALFTNKNFVSKCSVDKRGRPKNLSAKETYEKFYRLEEDESSTDEDEDKTKEADENGEDVSENESEAEAPNIDVKTKSKLLSSAVDYARGEGNLYSDSSSEEETDSDDGPVDNNENEEEEEGEYFDKWGELDADAEKTEEATERLAVCNMDWDRVGAEDIFLVLSSFCPPSGTVAWVKIFLSEFGKERLEEEKTLGPKELRRLKGEQEGNDTDDDEEDDLDHIDYNKKALKRQAAAMEKVRQYQVNRLKYYYAVVQFDNVQTASKVYDECDGMEYELSATRLDLRFIPGDMDFMDSPVSSCLLPPDPEKYQPKLFCTTALQQGKVELTWDEEDQDKMKAMKDAYSKVDNDDFGNMSHLIGSGSDSEDENEDDQDSNDESDGDGEEEKDAISKYKALLSDISQKESKEDQGNMEVTWNDEDVTEEAQEELTPWEKYLKKKKDKKKKKKSDNIDDTEEDDIPDGVDINDPFFAEELGEDYVKSEKVKKKKKKQTKTDKNDNPEGQKDLALMVMDSDDEKDHFDFKHIVEAESKEGKSKKKKWKKKKRELEVPADDNFAVDVSDNRFSAMFNRPEYNIDPTNPNFKKTKNMDKILGEKQKRISSNQNEERDFASSKKQKIDPEVSQALKSVKNKWNKNKMKNSKAKLKFTVKDN